MNLHQIVLDYIEESDLYRKGDLSFEENYGCAKILDKFTFKETYLNCNPNITDFFIKKLEEFVSKFEDDYTLYKVSDSVRMRSGYLLIDSNKKEVDFLDVIFY